MSLSVLSRLLHEGRPERAAVATRRNRTIDFGEFRLLALAVAAACVGRSRVALVCEDGFVCAAGFLGGLLGGAEVVLPPNGLPRTLDSLPGGYDCLLDDAAILAAPGHCSAAMPLAGPIDAQAAQVTFFTSGSTGAPKSVTRSLAMLEHEIAAIDAAFGGLPGHGAVLSTVSHQHLYGLTFRLLWPLAAGRAFDAETLQVWESVIAAGLAQGVLIASPAHLSRLGGLTALPAAHQPAAIFSAGAPLSAADALAVREILGVLPTEIFGSTESGAVATRRQVRGGEAWRLLPGVTLCIEADGTAAFAASQTAGWVATGDLVTIDETGVRFLGRRDGVLKIEGKRVSLAEIEAGLLDLPLVDQAAAVLLPGKPARLAAAVVLTEMGQALLDAEGSFRFGRRLARLLAPRLEPMGRPKRWRFVAALPQRQLGKRDEPALAALFTDGVA
jgi:acyl-coenzyme A synthetase/AMP-(fatty) acid ligase